ncbi:aminotransferase class I/II-fold pyridoxal phosphate-dependent enzyme [Agrobacterium rhizogenes]|uniref:aminotransferase class I/II-fold pyridoxal phosphate-dependent enzyme n=1 Tax=Rhizobium rhizogenes TaxID=359 RepID=UPI0022B69D55|nr:aminotransferase class I/II-fold pyridoxal phosphate-dependent enzyme [Rhizobium rhizogenes]MCZ7450273.1 aminotransferase class I/II-fold pyridoxal phosphate-dependent enzyme [Rhizobium rhizogenes]
MSLLPQSGTAKARIAAQAAQTQARDIIDMSGGEIWAELIQPIREGALQAIADNAARYTETIGMLALREAVAEKISFETGQSFSRDEVAITAGAKQALYNIAMCLFDPGDQVIIPSPYWGTFPAQVKLAGGTPVFVETRSNGFIPRIEDMERVVTPLTRAIIVNTPNNPTGAIYDRQTLILIARLAVERKLWVIFDECYAPFVHDGSVHHPIVSLVPEVREHLVIVNAFSKSLALTGWRIGYLAAPPRLVRAVDTLQGHMTSNPNVIAQAAILHYLRNHDRRHEARLLSRLQMSRQEGLAALSRLRTVPVPQAQGGFYFYLDLGCSRSGAQQQGSVSDAQNAARLILEEAGVATVPGTAFGDRDGIRLSYGIDPALVREGCERVVAQLNARASPDRSST